MDVSSESGSTKRPRKTLTARKRAPVVLEMIPEPTIDLTGKIATTAFFLAADRNFAPGHELDDWLEAERRVLGGIP